MVVALISLALGFYQSFRPGSTTKVQWVEGVAILVAIAVIVVVQALNDYQQERKFMRLNAKVDIWRESWLGQKEDRNVKVIRDGRRSLINVHDVLVGDVMWLEAGDVIPVDGILVEGYNVTCDEAASTGESDTVRKVTADIALAKVERGIDFNPKFDHLFSAEAEF